MRKDNSGSSPPPASCSISRRQLLQVGGLSLLPLGLPQLLGAETQRVPRRPGGTARSCILIVQQGGPSHLDTWDLKPDAPAEIRGPFQPIQTRVPGIQICELLPRLAELSDRYCLVRSMRQPSADHLAGMHICLSGRSPTISKQGRDHWPHCYSAMLAGGGVRGGKVYGSSDRHGAYVKDGPVSPEDFGATLLSALGIPPGTRLAPDGFTNPASAGQPVPGLLG